MKILLTHAYSLHEDVSEQTIMKPYPPLGLLYISEWLKKNEVEHEVYDTTFSTTSRLLAFIRAFRPQLAGFYVNFMTRKKILNLIRIIREYEHQERLLIVLGGPDITHNKENYLNSGADILVGGEGERTFFELVKAASENRSFKNIDGISYLEKGEVISTHERKRESCPDLFGFPNRNAIPILPYLDTWKKHHGYTSLNISTMRGCPFSCNWCSKAVFGKCTTRRSPEHVVSEIEWISRIYQPDRLWFVDDVFTLNSEWLKEFAGRIEKNRISLSYECISRVEMLDEETIRLLKRSGCRQIWMGTESGSQHIIDSMERRFETAEALSAIHRLRNAGIRTGLFIMLGYPGESFFDIRQTISFLMKAGPDDFTITLAYPIRGTVLYDQVSNRLTKNPVWSESSDRDLEFQRTFPDQFYKHAIRYITNQFYTINNVKKGKNIHPETLKYLLKSGLAKSLMFFQR